MIQTDPEIFEPQLIEEPNNLKLPSPHVISNNNEIFSSLIAELMYAMALPQPPEPEDDRDWYLSSLYKFVSRQHLKKLIECDQVTLVSDEETP